MQEEAVSDGNMKKLDSSEQLGNTVVHAGRNEVAAAYGGLIIGLFDRLAVYVGPVKGHGFHYRYRHSMDTIDMTGKVVSITRASSGIGEHLAYEYAKKGACLVLVARRESRLREVADRARKLGSSDVLLVCADVSDINDCKRFVDETINHFGRCKTLGPFGNLFGVYIIRIGSTYSCSADVTKYAPVMDINFWGSVYPTYFAIPHLKKSKGKIVVNSSSAAVFQPPQAGFYGASKAALVSYYESLGLELAPTITVSIVTLGYIDTEMIKGKDESKEATAEPEANRGLEAAIGKDFPVMSAEPCAKAIVNGTCRGDTYITEPQFIRVLFLLKYLCPELMDWFLRKLFLKKETEASPRSRGNFHESSHVGFRVIIIYYWT
ncbi:hypothetical protein RJ639_032998 [Escallonia herrerae]|uniref:Uncharacterized protein n=1 Tax=Escallonia herrerae TaxID=1293975 RepID=A0AA88WXJ9_9ASTE|nr:hypothetical protein RJ639_032998 [Escallonia herrerae]